MEKTQLISEIAEVAINIIAVIALGISSYLLGRTYTHRRLMYLVPILLTWCIIDYIKPSETTFNFTLWKIATGIFISSITWLIGSYPGPWHKREITIENVDLLGEHKTQIVVLKFLACILIYTSFITGEFKFDFFWRMFVMFIAGLIGGMIIETAFFKYKKLINNGQQTQKKERVAILRATQEVEKRLLVVILGIIVVSYLLQKGENQIVPLASMGVVTILGVSILNTKLQRKYVASENPI